MYPSRSTCCDYHSTYYIIYTFPREDGPEDVDGRKRWEKPVTFRCEMLYYAHEDAEDNLYYTRVLSDDGTRCGGRPQLNNLCPCAYGSRPTVIITGRACIWYRFDRSSVPAVPFFFFPFLQYCVLRTRRPSVIGFFTFYRFSFFFFSLTSRVLLSPVRIYCTRRDTHVHTQSNVLLEIWVQDLVIFRFKWSFNCYIITE